MSKIHITPPKVFAHLQPSLFADSIYYADLFRFNETIWMITGCGKSKAAQLIIGNNKENDLGRDAVAIKAENDTIIKYNYIAHCLTENQSKDLKDSGVTKLSITEVDNKRVARLLSVYLYPGFSIKHLFSEEECIRLSDPERRYDRFLDITDRCVSTKFVLVPWTNSLEEKAMLYQEFLRNHQYIA